MQGAKRSILLVDDDEDILFTLSAAVEHYMPGIRVLTATDGRQGLAIVRSLPISLILSDYRMPGMDGIEFLRAAKNLAPNVARIMMTAYPDPELASAAQRECGVNLVIPKPFDIMSVVALLRGALRVEGVETFQGAQRRP